MSKAIAGYTVGSDWMIFSEVRRLQARVQDLEAELVRVQSENDALVGLAEQQSWQEDAAALGSNSKRERVFNSAPGSTGAGGVGFEDQDLSTPGPVPPKVEELSSRIDMLIEMVSQLTWRSSSIAPMQFTGDDSPTEFDDSGEPDRLIELVGLRPQLASALRATADDDAWTDVKGMRYWVRVAGFLAVGGLLDLHGIATAAALEEAYNRARGVEFSRHLETLEGAADAGWEEGE